MFVKEDDEHARLSPVLDSFDYVTQFLQQSGLARLEDEDDFDSEYEEESTHYSSDEEIFSLSEEDEEEDESDENEPEKEEEPSHQDQDQAPIPELGENQNNPESEPHPIEPTDSKPVSIDSLISHDKPNLPIPSNQSQTPPITPEQLNSRKRSHTPATPSQPLDLPSPPTDSPIHRPIAPMPKRRMSPTPVNLFALYDAKISALEQRERELAAEREEFERTKRRRVSQAGGWVKTAGKYTVAGMVGGIATFVGLAMGALSRSQ